MSCALHVLQFVDEALREFFDLVNVKVGRFLPKGHTLGCIEDEIEIDRTFCSQEKKKKTNQKFDVSKCIISWTGVKLV